MPTFYWKGLLTSVLLLCPQYGGTVRAVLQDGPRHESVSPEADYRRAAVRYDANDITKQPPTITFSVLLDRSTVPDLELSDDQKRQIRDLVTLTQAMLREAMLAEVDIIGAPGRKEEEGLAQIGDTKQEIGFLADRMLYTGILKRDQGERLRRTVWRARGVDALSDDTLAARLRLSRLQRVEIGSRIANAKRMRHDMNSNPQSIDVLTNPMEPERAEALDRQIREKNDAAEKSVVEVLSPRQFEEWSNLIRPVRAAPAPHH